MRSITKLENGSPILNTNEFFKPLSGKNTALSVWKGYIHFAKVLQEGSDKSQVNRYPSKT